MPTRVEFGDLLRPPLPFRAMTPLTKEEEAILDSLPSSWKTTFEATDKWPFIDPDDALTTPDKNFASFPNDKENLPELPAFSEFEPWGIMDTETTREYEFFSHYRSEGLTRSYAKTARFFKISDTYIGKVGSQNNWQDRVRAWDRYREQIYTTEVIEGVRKMAQDHAKVANKAIRGLSSVFDELLRRIEEDPEQHKADLAQIPFKSLFQLVDKAARTIPNMMNAERLSRGLPTELSANVIVQEQRVVVQTEEELAHIVFGLQDVLKKRALSTDNEDDIVDIEPIEDDDETENEYGEDIDS